MEKVLTSKNQSAARERPGLREKLKNFGSNLWQTLLLCMIVVFLIGLLVGACRLESFTRGDYSPQLYTFCFVVFAFLAYSFSLLIWEWVLPQIRSDYKLGWLASFVFFSFAVLGVVAFVIFMYDAFILWWEGQSNVCIIAPLMGIVFFGSFIGKIMMD